MNRGAPVQVTVEEMAKQQQFFGQITGLLTHQPKKYYIHTFGCQMNVHDSEKLSGMLEKMGFAPTNSKDSADFVILNTCCVREHAENKVHGLLGVLSKQKKQKPDLFIAVCGCMMQQKEVVSSVQSRFPAVNLVFGTHNLHAFPQMVYEALTSMPVFCISDDEYAIAENVPVSRKAGVLAWVNIMYGCDNYCSYCIVPFVRGRERSRHANEIVMEVEGLVSQGYKEITLLGQNVNSYGKDIGEMDFAGLLRQLNKIKGLLRIRFMTSHPKDLSDALIDAMASCKSVCKQLHLPIQSGSTRILGLMNRQYTREDYISLVKKLRTAIPNIGLSTDIIVGFPGETEEDFEQTLSLMQEIRFQNAYMFKYSIRKGTRAAEMDHQIDEFVKKERLERLLQLQDTISKEISQSLVGGVLQVLAEEVQKKDASLLSGRSDEGKTIVFAGNSNDIGQLLPVKIVKARANVLIGEHL